MARKKRATGARTPRKTSPRSSSALPEGYAGLSESVSDLGSQSRTTGRMLVTLRDDGAAAIRSATARLGDEAGLTRVASASDFESLEEMTAEADTPEVMVLDEIGVMVLNGDADQMQRMSTAGAGDDDMIVEPEYWNYATQLTPSPGLSTTQPAAGSADCVCQAGEQLDIQGASAGFLRGYQHAVNSMVDMVLSGESDESGAQTASGPTGGFSDHAGATWGLQATRVVNSRFSGRGVKVAVLDTGLDAAHPDFSGRSITRRAFIPSLARGCDGRMHQVRDTTANDLAGHGTHCTGTACGPLQPRTGVRRYGIAHGAEIFSAKVLAQIPSCRSASGMDGWILQGIAWAIRSRCDILSMSLGSGVAPHNCNFPQAYESAARRALQRGILFLAAAGNESQRRVGRINGVGRPANCPSIASVAAVDSRFRVADFSNRAFCNNGGEINLSGPGVNVFSSIPGGGHQSFNGTSMACPHAAGIAALIAEETGKRGLDLFREAAARVSGLGRQDDFGLGLVRA